MNNTDNMNNTDKQKNGEKEKEYVQEEQSIEYDCQNDHIHKSSMQQCGGNEQCKGKSPNVYHVCQQFWKNIVFKQNDKIKNITDIAQQLLIQQKESINKQQKDAEIIKSLNVLVHNLQTELDQYKNKEKRHLPKTSTRKIYIKKEQMEHAEQNHTEKQNTPKYSHVCVKCKINFESTYNGRAPRCTVCYDQDFKK